MFLDQSIPPLNANQNNTILRDVPQSEPTVRVQVAQDSIALQESEVRENLKIVDQITQEDQKKEELEIQLLEWKAKVTKMDEAAKLQERNNTIERSELRKDKALLAQNLSFLETSLKISTQKEEELFEKLNTQRLAQNNQSKEMQNKLDSTTRLGSQQISDLQDRLSELEVELSSKNELHENDLKSHQNKQQQVELQIQDLSEHNKQLQKEIWNFKRQEQTLIDKIDSDDVTKLLEIQQELQATKEQLKQSYEQQKQIRNQTDTNKALMQQKLDFMELQLSESRSQQDETRKAHDLIMKAFGGSSQDNLHKSDNTKLAEVRDQHKREMKQIEIDHDVQRKKYEVQIDQLTEKNNEMEIKVKFETGDLLQEVEQLKEQLQEVESHKMRLLEQNKTLDGQKLSLLKEQEQRYLVRIQQLETIVEEADDKTAHELQAAQQKAEASLAQLKNFYEIERERLERRISEEREKNEKKYQSSSDEYYQKGKEQEQQYEEEIETLKDDLREQESIFQNMVQQYEHELALKQQTNETLERYIKETKESLLCVQQQNNQTLEQQLNAFNLERKGFITKIDYQVGQMNSLQKEQMSLQQRRDLLENEKLRKQGQLDQSRKEWTEERKQLSDKLEESKTKLQNITDEHVEKKIEYGREMALLQQQNEFQQSKIEEQSKQIENQCTRYEERIKLQKSENQGEINEKIEQTQQDRNTLEQKYEKIKKILKETEANAARQISSLERNAAIIMEKLSYMEIKKLELESQQKEDNYQFASLKQNFKEQLGQEKKQLITELDKYKHLFFQADQDKNEILTNYERDRALWEGKFSFLEQQKEQAKQDLVDALKKFEMTLMHLQRARNNEKDDQESSLNELILSVERKYQSQIDEANQTHSRVVQDYEDKNRRIQKEIKLQKDQQIFDQHGKLGSLTQNDKKFAELIENEKILKQEILSIQADRDTKVVEYSRHFDKEREMLKSKYSQLETRHKEVETKRCSQIFEFEKERAKWNLDRDHLVSLRTDLSDQLEKVDVKKDFLMRENEKLKNEHKASRRSGASANNISQNVSSKYKPTVTTVQHKLSPSQSHNTSMSSVVGTINTKKQIVPSLVDVTNFNQTQLFEQGRLRKQASSHQYNDDTTFKYQTQQENKQPLKQRRYISDSHGKEQDQ